MNSLPKILALDTAWVCSPFKNFILTETTACFTVSRDLSLAKHSFAQFVLLLLLMSLYK